MKKVLFISAYNSPFVKRDMEILQKEFKVSEAKGRKLSKSIFNYIWIILTISWQVINADFVYCWFADFRARAGIFWTKLFHKKSVVVIGGYEIRALIYPNKESSKFNLGRHFIYCLNHADSVLTVSDVYQDRLTDIFPKHKNKIRRIYIGFMPPNQNNELIEKENTVITVCAGRNKERIQVKGLDLFVKTAKLLPMYNFIIIGPTGDLARELVELKESDNLEILPNMEEESLRRYYQKAKVYCQFSRYESFGLALVEAMSWQCIPVVSPISSLMERIGNRGFILSEFNPDKAAELVLSALNSNEEAGVEAAKWVNMKYDIKIREKEIIELLKRL